MIHLSLPDGQAFKVERKGLQLTYSTGRVQHNQPTFTLWWGLWLQRNKLIR